MRKRATLWLAAASLILAGCSANETIRMEYYPPTPEAGRDLSVAVSVVDERRFVTVGDKSSDFVGQYRSGLGIPFDVTTASGLSLADTIARDLRAELGSLGFATDPANAGTRVEVTIRDWNFDAYYDARFSYEFLVEVRNAQGQVMAAQPVSESTIVEGSRSAGKKGGFAHAMRRLYRDAIVSLVRDNPPVLGAIQ